MKSEHVHNELAPQAGGLLIAYSLGGTAVKSYYQYKNNAVVTTAVFDDGAAVVADDEPTPTAKTVE